MNVELSVIIVNYNGRSFLKGCLEALHLHLVGIAFEIIIIDNNSMDGSREYIKNQYKKIILLESAKNLGFGKANNEGVKKAKGTHLLLINYDTILLDHIIDAFKYLKADRDIGVIGINMLNASGSYIQAAGNFPKFHSMIRMKNLLAKGSEFSSGNFKNNSYQVDWLAGSFLMLPKHVYERISGFDIDYFMYVEDVDFCKRIANLGLKRIFLPNYNYIHFVGYNKSKNHLLIKGYKIYLTKHYKGFHRWALLTALKINASVKTLKNKRINLPTF